MPRNGRTSPLISSSDWANYWLSLTRANFLPLTVVIVAAGLSAAFFDQKSLDAVNASLTLIGALLTHIAVNIFNNYFDYKMGVDERTVKTPFSGGVSVIAEGKITPRIAFNAGLVSLIGAATIGMHFLRIIFWPTLPILAYGGVSICLYTPYLSRLKGLSEIIAGTNFGLMAVGTYVVQTGQIGVTALVVFFPSSMLVSLLLFLNEFPDVEADRFAGRKHLVIMLGRKRCSQIYVGLLAVMYFSIILPVVLGLAPLALIIALGTAPFAFKAARISLESYEDVDALLPAMASNVIVVLVTIALISAGLLIGAFL